ncbi:MAG: DUF1016 N-terminal domain-containing protein [Treponema sp.]|nr:DUF1016 N-terminal domain-containing protein [Treponema sp.]
MAKKKPITKPNNISLIIPEDKLFKELSILIEKSKQKAVSQVKSTANLLFWHIGKTINYDILNNKRAEYGQQIVVNIAERLTAKYGQSYEIKNLRRMMQFAVQFPDKKIVVPLARQLSWSHFIIIIPLKTMKERLFYA